MDSLSATRLARCWKLPSFIQAPLQLAISGGEPLFNPRGPFAPNPVRLRIVSGSTTIGPGAANVSDIVTAPLLDRLQRQVSYFNQDGTPTAKMQLDWQNTMESIEAALGGLTGQVGDVRTLVEQIQAALKLAGVALDAASQTQAQVSIASSYTDPSSVLTASSDGTIQIAAHERVYGDGARVSVLAGSVGGFNPGDYVSVYYDDATRMGGAVTYQGTTNAIAQGGNRHSLGQIAIPAAGEAPSTGGGVAAPGYTPGNQTPRQYEEYV